MKFWHREKFGIILTLSSSALLLVFISTVAIYLLNPSPEKKQKVQEQLTEKHQEREREKLQNNYQKNIKNMLGQIDSNSSVEEKFSKIEEFLFNQRVPKEYLNQHLSAAVEFKKTKQKFSSGAINKEDALASIKDLLNSITK